MRNHLDFPQGRGSSTLWLLVHIGFPMLPFVLGGCLRALVIPIGFDTFSASDLSMSLGLLSVFVHQSLRLSKQPIMVGSRGDDLNAVAVAFQGAAIGAFAIFGALAILSALVSGGDRFALEQPLDRVRIFAFAIAPPIIYFSYRVQKSFNLKAVI